jgi:hypothetical protein
MLPSGLAENVDDEEDLTRFLTSSSQFNAVMVKPAVFLPNPKNGETSVFRHGSFPRALLWQIAKEQVRADRTLHGAAIVKAKHVRSALLDVVAQEPPPRHANIVGWPSPTTDPDLGKAARRERALVIAQHAELVRR